MGGGVAGALPLVVAPGDDDAVDDDDRAHRHVAVDERGLRLVEGDRHRGVDVHTSCGIHVRSNLAAHC